MYEDFFADRLASLRSQKNVSAREMSLAIGQNGSYINRIENKLAFPSMRSFFYICEYLRISPKEFFDEDISNPILYEELIQTVKGLDAEQMLTVLSVARGLRQSRQY